jgi:hypothetical protein
MWCCVDIVLTDISEKRIASIFTVEEKGGIRELRTSVSMCSETLVNTISTRRHIPEDWFLYLEMLFLLCLREPVATGNVDELDASCDGTSIRFWLPGGTELSRW